ncbi:MAG TPA: adenylyltransferase/cytidyltransferase family protein, partial [Phycisphaerae bacterium]|nr:adenylyltransferase/cytidyltransferase family protein [Phycisphaerae bacterium]
MSLAFQRKIVNAADLAQTLREPRAAGRKVVQCHGCFDIVHPGHVRYLQSARRLGDLLVVSLTGDANVSKGPDRPHIPQDLRAENLAALEFVDWVVIDPNPTAADLIALLRPDVYVKGREYAENADPRFLREREIVESYGGRVVFHSGEVVFSSTRLIEGLRDENRLEAWRLHAFCRRCDIGPAAVDSVLERFRAAPVLVVGDVIRERYVHCDTSSTADDAPMLALQNIGETSFWGGAAAVALQLQALGAAPFLLAGVGSDAASQELRQLCEQQRIGCHLPVTRRRLVQVDTFLSDDTKVLRLSNGGASPVESQAETVAFAAIAEPLRRARLVLWCDHGYGAVSPGLLWAVNSSAERGGATIAGHAPGPRGDLARLRGAHLLAMTERKLRTAMNDLESGLSSVAWQLLNQTGGRMALVSMRKRGLIGFDGRHADAPAPSGATAPAATSARFTPERLRTEFVESLARVQADVLGADETILAVAGLALAVGASLPLAMYLA